ncbi:MAG: NmrA family NAD(P)-binding protein [Anaerolineaceae bacterium]|nr:NmrA family NAD(P)-binding protein [Anaerolineaceae bacterium]
MILITGAAGKTGRAVIQAVAARGEVIRAWVHRPEQINDVTRLGARQVTTGSYTDPQALARAMQGVQSVYHICSNVNPDELLIGTAILAAAKTAGVQHFGYHSVLHPQTEDMPHHWQKLLVEAQILESGLNYTIIQPSAYMQNVLAQWNHVITRGIYSVPYRVSTRLSLVDLNDVAEAAAVVLTQPGHSNAIYELSGGEALTQREVAQSWGRALDKNVRAEQVSLSVWELQARAGGMGDYAVTTLLKMFQYYDRFGFCGNPRVLSMLLGHEPVAFASFISKAIAEWEESRGLS